MVYASPRRWDIGDAISAGWRLFWPNILPMGLFALVVVVVNSVLTWITPADAGFFVASVFWLVQLLVTQLITIGWIGLALDIVDGKPVSAERIMSRFNVVVPFLIASLLFSIGLYVGLLLLIVPGIVFALIFYFYSYSIVDTGEGNPIAALQHSARLTRGHRVQLFGLFVLLVLINIIGVLALVVGVLITMGISLLAVAYVYRQLSGSQRTLA